jgi:hypothetical protein
MFTRTFDRRVRLFLGTLAFALVLGVSFGTYALWPANQETGYQPAQPVYFPHSVMAGKHRIDCLYCHTEAEKGPHAGIPALSTCMKCHQEIQTKDARGQLTEPIRALLAHWETREPIAWLKVHDLADFVYFDHSRHLTPQAGLTCTDCHGEVEKMDRVERVHSLKMGWCLDCHKEPPPADAPPTQTTRAPITCSTCHR